MKLFLKSKDFNNLLEEILDRKIFSSVAKSLCLSMIYKLEIAYRDYEDVNPDCISKETFFFNILDVIKKYCDNIKFVEPESSQATLLIENDVMALTNTKERSMLLYPTEIAMLYAISDIEPKYYFMKKDYVFKDIFQKVLVSGYKQNTISILKNFNGWSWNINSDEKINYTCNLIYQNIIMIKGEQFLYDWRTDNRAKKDYLENLKKSVKKVTGNDNYYLSMCKTLYAIAKKSDKAKIETEMGKNKDRYSGILDNNKTEYEELIELQKHFLKFFEKKIIKISDREEIIKAIYQLRFYQNIPLFNDVLIKDYSELKNILDSCLKLVFTKACKMSILKIISMDIETNFELFKYILDTRIINLEEIKVYLEIENEDILIKVYDKEIFEKQGKIKFKGNKNDIVFKKKKLIKIFN